MAFLNFYTCACIILLLLSARSSRSDNPDPCFPGGNCPHGSCRCWNDNAAPGHLNPPDTPQMIAVSFIYAINEAKVNNILTAFGEIINPNACPAVGTFFVPVSGSSPDSVKLLSQLKHEIGVTAAEGTLPKNWTTSFKEDKDFWVSKAGIADGNIQGAIAPDVVAGGDTQLRALRPNGLTYDSSCATVGFSQPGSMIWPYTYDFVYSTPECENGVTPGVKVPGVWELIIPELEHKGRHCLTPSSCTPYLDNSNATAILEFFENNFLNHYNHKRTPLHIVIDEAWFDTPAHLEGTQKFIEKVRTAYKDTWIITHGQIVNWMRNPVNSHDALQFPGWGC